MQEDRFIEKVVTRASYMFKVDDAIILAGGVGSRMLPASLFAPKEVLPLVDTPALYHLILESAKAGVSRVHIVLSEQKMHYIDQFLRSRSVLFNSVRPDLPRSLLSLEVEGLEILFHIQNTPGGVGEAISVALGDINGPFTVILGDMIMMDSHVSPENMDRNNASSASLSLVQRYEKSGLPCAGVFPVEVGETHKYGVVKIKGGLIKEIIEKPEAGAAPSNHVLCGRYLLTDETSGYLEEYPTSRYGELQSIYLLKHFIKNGGLAAVNLEGMRMYDSGDPYSWLISQIDHALRRDDFGKELEKWIKSRVE